MLGRSGPATIPAALIDAAGRFPGREAVVDGPVRMTYGELHQQVRRCASLFIDNGIHRGDRVAICSPNTQHWVIAALGALYCGATLVPVNTRFTGPEMLDVVERSETAALVVAGPFLGTDRIAELRAAGLGPLRLILRIPADGTPPPEAGVVDWAAVESMPVSPEADARADAVAPDDVSDILFTSGTTGRSKGAMSAHRQSIGVARAWADCGQLTAEDRYLVINPFFHSFGYKAGMLAALLSGCTILPQRTFDVDATMRVIAAERITVLPGAPTIYQTMLDSPGLREHDLSSLRLAVTGAATVAVALVERMRADLSFDTVLTAYGLTEAVVATMCRPDDDAETIARTCGRAAADFEVRTAEDSGEILLRGPNTMLGYLDDPEATAEAIDVEGWLHTGDVGTLDERGYLKITDRIKDMYICGGFNVYPAEVEQALARLDGVADSAVIGVPDTRMGEVGRAYVVRRPGADVSASDIVEHCKAVLANYKVPRQVEFRDQLPRNPSGKVLKRVLRDEEAKA
ncbi:Acyl-CoA synthetase (AMP-forming)/AMP-acid ligase II [Amycolatopsis marina]|uniref:Acyl-CoA synthetase (AMP-forming)/AMP-acid ligase II n=1 Tax=Amycolatopsis marina TaxID=490629 RepID=A0A1I1BB77_9PSEU|nr:FadD3 family acyl-CoA ligase [Amycolatopsis marina]SFB45958.1 Acyl-CoA synthetase (AMP-forming)/AMP-acid ligase II [Amycolatopsis marina]